MSWTSHSFSTDSKKRPDVQCAKVPSPLFYWLVSHETGALACVELEKFHQTQCPLSECYSRGTPWGECPCLGRRRFHFLHSVIQGSVSNLQIQFSLPPVASHAKIHLSILSCVPVFVLQVVKIAHSPAHTLKSIVMASVGLRQHILLLPLEEKMIWERTEVMVSLFLHFKKEAVP